MTKSPRRSRGTLLPSAARLRPQDSPPCYAKLLSSFCRRPGTRSASWSPAESCPSGLSSQSHPCTAPPSSGPRPSSHSPPSTNGPPPGRRRPGPAGRSWSVPRALRRPAVFHCKSPSCCHRTAAAWDGLYLHPTRGHYHLYAEREIKEDQLHVTPQGPQDAFSAFVKLAVLHQWGEWKHVGVTIKDNQITSRLTEQSVEVSVFAWHGDDHRFQTFLSPHLQIFQPGLIHFLCGLKLLHTAPHAISPGEEEQRRPSEDYVSLFLDELSRRSVDTETQKTTPTKVERLVARGWTSERRKTHNI